MSSICLVRLHEVLQKYLSDEGNLLCCENFFVFVASKNSPATGVSICLITVKLNKQRMGC